MSRTADRSGGPLIGTSRGASDRRCGRPARHPSLSRIRRRTRCRMQHRSSGDCDRDRDRRRRDFVGRVDRSGRRSNCPSRVPGTIPTRTPDVLSRSGRTPAPCRTLPCPICPARLRLPATMSAPAQEPSESHVSLPPLLVKSSSLVFHAACQPRRRQSRPYMGFSCGQETSSADVNVIGARSRRSPGTEFLEARLATRWDGPPRRIPARPNWAEGHAGVRRVA